MQDAYDYKILKNIDADAFYFFNASLTFGAIFVPKISIDFIID
jgi:hypothetical protein